MIYLISLLGLLLPSYLIRFSVAGIPSTALEVAIYLGFLYGLYRGSREGFRKISLAVVLPVILLLIALVISTIITPDKRVALGELKGFFIDPILVGWLIWQFANKENYHKIFWGISLGGLVVAVDAITRRLIGQVTADSRVVGIFGYSPNYIALFLAPIVVWQLAFLLDRLRRKKRVQSVLCVLLILLNLAAMYFSGSRGGFLAVLAGIGAMIIVEFAGLIKKRFSAKIIVLIVLLLAIYTSWTLFRPNFDLSGLSGGRVVTSNNVRWQIWQTSIEMIKKEPLLGVGLGNYQNYFGELTKNRVNFPEFISPVAFTPHNLFLMFYLTTGPLGLIAFLGLVYLFFHQLIEKPSMLGSQLVPVMVAILVYGLIDTPYWKNDLSVFFWIIWGLAWI